MKLTFLDTRGNIEARTRRHRQHSALMVSYYGHRIMVDCGQDWRNRLHELDPEAIVITHAHPDHAWGLKDGAPCPVYATAAAWESIERYPVEKGSVVEERATFSLAEISFKAFAVEHSTLAPAVGYRISAGRVTIFYVPDVAYIPQRRGALAGARLYIGDGATLTRSMVRKQDDALIGHAPVRTQLTWCQKEGVPRAVFTHCGSQIVKGDERTLGAELQEMAATRGVEAEIARDGLEMVLR